MAIGFTPKFELEQTFEGYTSQQLLALSTEAIKALEWNLILIGHDSLIAYTSKSIWKANFEVVVRINDNTISVLSKSTGSEFFDMNKNKKNVKKFFEQLVLSKAAFSSDDLGRIYDEWTSSFISDEENILKQPEPTTFQSVKDFFSIFVPNKEIFVTPILIDINIIIFILMAINGAGIIDLDNQALLDWGADFRPLTVDENEWWRLFTNMFLHGGIIHLLMNMYALLFIGVLLEPLLGKVVFITFYILTGIAASTTSLYWHDYSVCVGASGAIFGAYGIFLALLTTNIIHKEERSAFLLSTGLFVGYNLLYGIKGNTDNAAHIGGLLSGILFGLVIYFILKWKENNTFKIGILVLSALVTLLGTGFILKSFPKTYSTYQKQMSLFQTYENEALEFYTKDSTTVDNQIKQLEIGIADWKKCNAILDTIESLDLPIEYRVNLNELRGYVDLRLETYEIIHGTIQVTDLEKELEIRNKKIDSILAIINAD